MDICSTLADCVQASRLATRSVGLHTRFTLHQGPLQDSWAATLPERMAPGSYRGVRWIHRMVLPLLAGRQIFDLHLTAKQSAVVSEFMQQAILEEIDDQRGLYYKV